MSNFLPLPTQVELAIVNMIVFEKTMTLIADLDPRVRAYNDAYKIVQEPCFSVVDKSVIAKAQEIAKTNGWNWDEILNSVAVRFVDFQPSGMTALKNYEIQLLKNDSKHQLWLDSISKESAAKQAKLSFAEMKTQEIKRKKQYWQEFKEQKERNKIKGDTIAKVISLLNGQKEEVKNRLKKSSFKKIWSDIAIASGVRDTELLEIAFKAWKKAS